MPLSVLLTSPSLSWLNSVLGVTFWFSACCVLHCVFSLHDSQSRSSVLGLRWNSIGLIVLLLFHHLSCFTALTCPVTIRVMGPCSTVSFWSCCSFSVSSFLKACLCGMELGFSCYSTCVHARILPIGIAWTLVILTSIAGICLGTIIGHVVLLSLYWAKVISVLIIVITAQAVLGFGFVSSVPPLYSWCWVRYWLTIPLFLLGLGWFCCASSPGAVDETLGWEDTLRYLKSGTDLRPW
jgi:hypothetical protein